MDGKKGWIKLYRDIQEHWVYQDPVLYWTWTDILLSANHAPKELNKKYRSLIINRGQFWTSFRSLAIRWGVDPKTVKARLTLFQDKGMIYVDPQPGYGTLITVCNYDVYQGFSDDDSHRDSYRNSYRNSHREGFDSPTGNGYKQQDKELESIGKNGKKIYGRPGDPDYVEEV